MRARRKYRTLVAILPFAEETAHQIDHAQVMRHQRILHFGIERADFGQRDG